MRPAPARAALVLALALAAGGSACAKRPELDRSVALGDALPELPPVEDVPVHGFTVTVEAEARPVTGELLAVDPTALWVLEEGESGRARPVAIPRRDVRAVGVVALESGGTVTGVWAGIGTISTISHGFFLIFSVPVWAIVGVGTGLDEGLSNDLRIEPDNLDGLGQYARFPQGMPPELLQGEPRRARR